MQVMYQSAKRDMKENKMRVMKITMWQIVTTSMTKNTQAVLAKQNKSPDRYWSDIFKLSF
jgi:hypothetical protein